MRLCKLALGIGAILMVGCPAVYPELNTPIKKLTPDVQLDPGPPTDVRWIRFLSARVPERTRGGRKWDEQFGSLPDPYVIFMINGKEVFRTSVQSDTLEPTWPDAVRGNFEITRDDRLRVEVWDANPLNDHPIGVRDIGRTTDEQRLAGRIRAELEGGGEVVLAFEPAHAMHGAGMWYELRTNSAFVTRVLSASPAERVGIVSGDKILKVGDQDVSELTPDDVRSRLGAFPAQGWKLVAKHADGAILETVLKEGPIYPLYREFGNID